MLIEIGAPAMLPLGLVRLEEDAGPKTCLLGLTLRHPPMHLFAQAHPRLKIAGARADKGHEQALRFLQSHHLKMQAEVEIELAIPMFVGLGSDAMLALSVARALAWLHKLPPKQRRSGALAQALQLGPQHALEIWGFDQGGLLLVEAEAPAGDGLPARLRRHEIVHKEKDAWALVLFFPRVPADAPPLLEAERWAALLRAAPHLSGESGRLVKADLWPAVEKEDIAAFGRSLMALQQMNQAALASAGTPPELDAEAQTILDLMRDNGALAWGQSFSGLGLYGLVKGAKASIDLRKKLRDHVGIFGGHVMATVTDVTGAREIERDKNLDDNKLNPYRVKPGVSSREESG